MTSPVIGTKMCNVFLTLEVCLSLFFLDKRSSAFAIALLIKVLQKLKSHLTYKFYGVLYEFFVDSDQNSSQKKVADFACQWRDTYNVFHQLRSVTSNSFGGLEYVNFTVLDNLFDAGISSTIHTSPRLAIAARETEI